MKDDEDLVKRLREDPQYRAALGRARNMAERKAIASLVEGFVGGISAILGPAIEKAKKDPAFAAKLARALSEGKDVLSNSEQTMSGSGG